VGENLNIGELNNIALARWVPVWTKAFTDTAHGGFHERLGAGFRPVDMGYKRLLTQCRMLFVHGLASLPCTEGFDFLVRNHRVPETGGWRFSVTPEGNPKDNTYDLYGHAFVLLAMGFHYKATGETRALDHARETLAFLGKNFRTHERGFAEALGEDLRPLQKIRTQDPHMHLMEAALFLHDITGDPPWLAAADEMYALFRDFFFDHITGTLAEFFSDDLSRHPEKGCLLKTGHHYEWIWLLDKYARFRPGTREEARGFMTAMYDWAEKNGRDTVHGGYYDWMDTRNAQPTETTKRIWHATEALKAHAVMGNAAQLSTTVKLLRRYVADGGNWTEIMNSDLTPQTDFMPGTTPYHILMGVSEANHLATER
jgi:mannose/cellobiose epimerase-like protein (N-acyl-D-glucosamine 2-epimerase family)